MWHIPWNSAPLYIHIIQNVNFVIIVPADGLAPNGARPSAVAVLMIKLDMLHFKFLLILVIMRHLCWPDHVIQNGQLDLTKCNYTLGFDNDESKLI